MQKDVKNLVIIIYNRVCGTNPLSYPKDSDISVVFVPRETKSCRDLDEKRARAAYQEMDDIGRRGWGPLLSSPYGPGG